MYGDFDFDWEHRVNTMSGGVAWRERLLGALYSLYQPTEPAVFHEMLDALQNLAKLDYAEFIFVDLGSGKGRTLMMASDYPFQRIIGVELSSPRSIRSRGKTLRCIRGESQKCLAIESICADATTFPLPAAPLVLYLFNPFPGETIAACVACSPTLTACLKSKPGMRHMCSITIPNRSMCWPRIPPSQKMARRAPVLYLSLRELSAK